MKTLQTTKVRLADIAQLANTSVATVSMALSDHPNIKDETRKRIQMICKKVGYQRPGERVRPIADSFKMKPLRIGFLLIGSPLKDEILTSFLQQMSLRASTFKVRLELSSIEDTSNPNQIEKHLMEFIEGLDAILLEGMVEKTLLQKIENLHIPYAVIGGIIQHPGEYTEDIGHIIEENPLGIGKLAAGRLIALGHKRIGFLCERMIEGLWTHSWLQGYQLAHLNANLPLDMSLVHTAGKIYAGGSLAADYFSSMQNPPTAYVVPDIRIAASFIDCMNKKGISIPRESIIMGGHHEVAQKYNMETYPLICTDPEFLGRFVLDYLLNFQETPYLFPRKAVLPFKIYNFPEIS